MILKLHRPNWASAETAAAQGEPFARREYQALERLNRIFADHGPNLAVARPLALEPGHAAVLMDKAAGDKLSLAMRWARVRPGRQKALRELFAACGQWLAIWHAASGRMADSAPVIARLKSEFKDELTLCMTRGLSKRTVRAIYGRFGVELGGVLARQPVVVDMHCDFASYNVLVAGEAITVIDFEGVRPGLVCEDMAYFLGMLEATPPYHLSRKMIEDLRGSFLEGYEREAGIDREALDFFMLLSAVKIMARSPVLQPGGSWLDRIKRWQRLRFYRRILAERLK
jgi:Ser/Thr protein kinase RdoA (MazF antagonist)